MLAFSVEFNSKGYHYPVMALEDKCNGCDLCGLYCPDFALRVKYQPRLPGPAAKGDKKKEEG